MRLRFGALAVAGVLSLAACSSGGGHSGPSTSAAGSSSSSVSSPASFSAPVPATSLAATGSDPYCAKVADWSSKFQQFEAAITSNDPATLKSAFTQATAFFAGLKDGAPPAIAGSIGTITSALNSAGSAFSGSASPAPSTITSLTTTLTPAITTFTQWIATNCSAG